MIYSKEVENMCTVAKGPKHGPAPIPEEGKWVKSYDIKDISGLSHGIGWCAPQQGACKLTLNVKDGIVEEALVETIGCSGMTHSAAMAAEILPNKTLLECLNTDLVCDAINTAMKNIFEQLVYGRSQTAFSEGGLPIGAGMEDLGKGLRSQIRKRGERDRRVVYISLSEKGRKAYSHHREFHKQMIQGLLDTLNEQEQDLLVKVMQYFHDYFREHM